eukprot:SAG31_NODE_15222_length_764_cov_2.775940_1_plen_139_part_00
MSPRLHPDHTATQALWRISDSISTALVAATASSAAAVMNSNSSSDRRRLFLLSVFAITVPGNPLSIPGTNYMYTRYRTVRPYLPTGTSYLATLSTGTVSGYRRTVPQYRRTVPQYHRTRNNTWTVGGTWYLPTGTSGR